MDTEFIDYTPQIIHILITKKTIYFFLDFDQNFEA